MYVHLVLHIKQCMSFDSTTFISNSTFFSILGLKLMWEKILKLVWVCFYTYILLFTHFSMCVWRMLTLVRESCDSCWYSEGSSFLHSRTCRYDEPGHLSLGITILSFPCGFLYKLNAGVSNSIIYDIFWLSEQRASHLKASISLSPSVCQVS